MAKATALAGTKPRSPDSQGNGEAPNGEAPQALIPFIAASRRRTEPFHDETNALKASASTIVSNVDIPPIGFLARVHLIVEATGGDGSTTAAVANEDAPWNVFESIGLADVNGNSLIYPMDGFMARLLEKYGAYTFITDPAQLDSFSDVDSGGNFTFHLTLPVMITGRDALGCLANMNSSQTYKLSYRLAAAEDVYNTQPNTLPDVRVRGWIEVRTEPDDTAVDGTPQNTRPPNHGVTQYSSIAVFNLGSGGDQTLQFPRVGNIIRTLIAVCRNDSGARSTTEFPNSVRLEYDGNLVEEVERQLLRDRMVDQYGLTNAVDAAGGIETGVFVWSFTADLDGRAGWENKQEYLHTTSATRLDLKGQFGSNVDKLNLLTNDIAAPSGS